MIDSKTRLLGLIGHPVEHSLSPIFMNYLLRKLNLNYRYFAFGLQPVKLRDAFNGFKALGFKGINVTIPFKKEVIKYVDKLNEDAEKIGAINCIYNNNGSLVGFNTDYLGFTWPLKEYAERINNSNVLLIGCGGAARGVVYALKRFKVKSIKIVNRTEENAFEFIRWAKSIMGLSINISYLGDSESVTNSLLDDINLIINTTPVGMSPRTNQNPLPKDIVFNELQIVYDIIYTPWETSLLKMAKRYGAKTINGFPMLIAQGLYSLEAWFEDIKDELFPLYDEVLSFTREFLKV